MEKCVLCVKVGFFVFIQTECSLRYPDVAQSTLKAIQETVQSYCTRPDLSQHEEITHLLSNLLYVIRWEQSPSGHAVMRCVVAAVLFLFTAQ